MGKFRGKEQFWHWTEVLLGTQKTGLPSAVGDSFKSTPEAGVLLTSPQLMSQGKVQNREFEFYP